MNELNDLREQVCEACDKCATLEDEVTSLREESASLRKQLADARGSPAPCPARKDYREDEF